MATRQDGCRVVTPFLPSLLHLASVKIAVSLFEEFGAEVLKEAFAEIEHISATSEGSTTDSSNRGKRILLHTPEIQHGNSTMSVGSKAESRNRGKRILLHTPEIQHDNSTTSEGSTAESRNRGKRILLHTPEIQHGNSTMSEGSTAESRNRGKRILLHTPPEIQHGNSTMSEGSTGDSGNRTKKIHLHSSQQIQLRNSTSEGSTAESRNRAKEIQLHTTPKVHHVNSTASEGSTVDCRNRAKQMLLYIPAHLRWTVMKAVFGSQHAVMYWTWYHSFIFKFREEKCPFHWRSDGSIDEVKTVQSLVRNAKFDIKKRFKFACVYCLEESVQDLWAEMVESGEVESFGSWHLEHDIVGFWVERMRTRSLVPWTQSLIQSLGTFFPNDPPIFNFPPTLVPRFSVFFPHLQPEERQKFFQFLGNCTFDDLRFCLYTVTKNEEAQILEKWAIRLLRLHLEWPLQTLFLKTAEKLWVYINNGGSFCDLLSSILTLNDNWMDFCYSELFEAYWNTTPVHMKERARNCPHLRLRIDSYFDEKRGRKTICK